MFPAYKHTLLRLKNNESLERRSNYILFIFLGVIDTSLQWDNIKFFETQLK